MLYGAFSSEKHFLEKPHFILEHVVALALVYVSRGHLTLNDWSRGKQSILFPKDLNVSPRRSRSDLLYSTTKTKKNGGHRSTVAANSALLPSDVIEFAMLPLNDFWWETVLLLIVMRPRNNQ